MLNDNEFLITVELYTAHQSSIDDCKELIEHLRTNRAPPAQFPEQTPLPDNFTWRSALSESGKKKAFAILQQMLQGATELHLESRADDDDGCLACLEWEYSSNDDVPARAAAKALSWFLDATVQIAVFEVRPAINRTDTYVESILMRKEVERLTKEHCDCPMGDVSIEEFEQAKLERARAAELNSTCAQFAAEKPAA